MRLVYLINGLGPGGSERSLAEMLPHYLRSGIRPTIFCMRAKDRGVEAAVRTLGCDLRLLPPGGWFTHIRFLNRYLRTRQVDLLHTTLFDSDVVGRLAAVGTAVPVLSSLVNTGYDPVRLRDPRVRRSSLRVMQLLDGWTARHLTAHFHAVSQAVKNASIEALGIEPERITVVRRGRSAKRLGGPSRQRRQEVRTRVGLQVDDEVILNVGRQEYQKGQLCLLRSFALLARSRPRLVLVIAGREGHATPELLNACEQLQLGSRIRFLGHRDDVPDLLAAADIFAFPSLYEGCSGAVIEAMALGLPVVASNIPSLAEVVKDGQHGFLAHVDTPEAFAKAFQLLLENAELARVFGERSRQVYLEQYTIERSAQRMIDLYGRLAQRGKARVENRLRAFKGDLEHASEATAR